MSASLVRAVGAAFYSPHERLALEAILASSTGDTTGVIGIDEARLNAIVAVKATTLRAALGTLQGDQLLYAVMVQREGERYATRRWVLDLAAFRRVVRARLAYVRAQLASAAPEAAAHCETCDASIAADEVTPAFCCPTCHSPLADHQRERDVVDTGGLAAVEEELLAAEAAAAL